jgi:hypothetical protein
MTEILVINPETSEIELGTDSVELLEAYRTINSLNYNKQPGDTEGRKRTRVKTELKYVYLMYHPRTLYREYSEEEKHFEAKMESKLPENWVPSTELELFIAAYRKHSKPRVEKLLDAAEKAIDKVRIYLETVNFSERTAGGAIVNHPGDILKLISDLPKTAQSLQELQQQAKSHLIAPATKSRGDQQMGWLMEEKPLERI